MLLCASMLSQLQLDNRKVRCLLLFPCLRFAGLLTPEYGAINTCLPIAVMQIECIKTLLFIASGHNSYLGTAWLPVLKCISQLDAALNSSAQQQLHLMGSVCPGDGWHDVVSLSMD